MMKLALLLLSPSLLLPVLLSGNYASSRSYVEGERVKLRVNKLTSTKTLMPLEYYVLPFCVPPQGVDMDYQDLGKYLTGDRIESSPYYLEMKKDMYCEQLCVGNLGRAEMPNVAPNKMVKAIRKNYHNNWIVDSLPSASKIEYDTFVTTRYWGGFPIGFIDEESKRAYVHNHVNIEIMYYELENEPSMHRIVQFTVQPFSIKHDIEPIKTGEEDIEDDHFLRPVAKIRNPVESCATTTKATEHTSYDMVTASGRLPQEASGSVLYTYDVIWRENRDVKWTSRWDIYLYVRVRLAFVVARLGTVASSGS